MKLVLGSSSRWRQSLLRQRGIPHTVLVADIDEKAVQVPGCSDRDTTDPSLLTIAIAEAKADAIMQKMKENAMDQEEQWLITSDQVVWYDGRVREKPRDAEEAREYLHSYAISPAVTVTAICITVCGGDRHGHRISKVDRATQRFEPIPDAIIDKVIAIVSRTIKSSMIATIANH